MRLKNISFAVTILVSFLFANGKAHNKVPLKDIPSIVEETMPSVVSIFSQSGKYVNKDVDSIIENDDLSDLLNPDYEQPRSSDLSIAKCSGVVITSSGIIVSNVHCFEQKNTIKISTFEGKIYSAHIIAMEKKFDLALIQVDDTTVNFKPIKIGSSEQLRRGDDVLVIGNPMGFSNSVTRGIISNKGIKLGMHMYEDFIQTDAPINPGNSGGALINQKGELVGINDAILRSAQSMGFAIPSRMLVRVLDELIQNDKVRISLLGIKTRKVRVSEMKWNCLDGKPRMKIEDVVSNSAVSGKLKNGDVIIKIGRDEIHDMGDIRNAGIYNAPGVSVKIKFMRDCQLMEIDVVPSERTIIKKIFGPELESK